MIGSDIRWVVVGSVGWSRGGGLAVGGCLHTSSNILFVSSASVVWVCWDGCGTLDFFYRNVFVWYYFLP